MQKELTVTLNVFLIHYYNQCLSVTVNHALFVYQPELIVQNVDHNISQTMMSFGDMTNSHDINLSYSSALH